MRSEIEHSLSRMQYTKSSLTSIQHNKSKQKKNWEIWLKSLAYIFTIHFIHLSILFFIQSGVFVVANLGAQFQSFHRFQTSEFPKTLYIFFIVRVYHQWHIKHIIL